MWAGHHVGWGVNDHKRDRGKFTTATATATDCQLVASDHRVLHLSGLDHQQNLFQRSCSDVLGSLFPTLGNTLVRGGVKIYQRQRCLSMVR